MANIGPKSSASPIFRRSETWIASWSPEDVKAKVLKAFSDRGYRVKTTDSELEVTTGSKTLYRIWGELIPWGKNNAPVGLILSIQPTSGGAEVKASAFDRFGWRLTDKTFFGADETFTAKMDHLIQVARSASESEPQTPLL